MATPRRTPPATAAPPAGDERVVELTRRLAGVLTELGLSEVEVESTDVRVRVQKTSVVAPAVVAPTVAAAPTVASPERPLVGEVGGPTLVTVEAPMVGRSTAPPRRRPIPTSRRATSSRKARCSASSRR